MMKQSLLAVLLLLCPCIGAVPGEKTEKALYYLTKGACIGGATALVVANAPMIVATTSSIIPTDSLANKLYEIGKKF